MLLLTFLTGATARADDLQPRPREHERPAWVRLSVEDASAARRDWEKRGLDVVGADPRSGRVDVLAPPEDIEDLLERDQWLILSVESGDADRWVRDLRQYRRPAAVKAVLEQTERDFPLVATLEDLTPGGLFEGQHVYAVRLTSNAGPSPKPTVLFTCQIHAGESLTTEVCLDIVEVLARSYGADALVTRWLDAMEVWVVPMVNPDGTEYAIASGEHWRRNRNPVCPVDVNRNFPATWDSCDGASTDCKDEDYRGPAALTEPETSALRELLLRLHPRYHVDYHGFGEDITYPGGCGPVAKEAQLDALARGLQAVIADDDGRLGTYDVGTLQATVYPVSGSLMDESYQLTGTLSFLLEIGRAFSPDSSVVGPTVQRQRAGWQLLLSAVEQCKPDEVCTVTPDPVVGSGGCGCSAAAGPPLGPLVLLGLAASLRRRRR